MASGIGSFPLGVLKAGFTIATYHSIEIDPVTRGVLRTNLRALHAAYPQQPDMHAEQEFDTVVPQDLFAAARTVRVWLPKLQHAPNLLAVSTPCVGTSRAGLGAGRRTGPSAAVFPALSIAAYIMHSAHRAAPSAAASGELVAKCGWIFEAAEI